MKWDVLWRSIHYIGQARCVWFREGGPSLLLLFLLHLLCRAFIMEWWCRYLAGQRGIPAGCNIQVGLDAFLERCLIMSLCFSLVCFCDMCGGDLCCEAMRDWVSSVHFLAFYGWIIERSFFDCQFVFANCTLMSFFFFVLLLHFVSFLPLFACVPKSECVFTCMTSWSDPFSCSWQEGQTFVKGINRGIFLLLFFFFTPVYYYFSIC